MCTICNAVHLFGEIVGVECNFPLVWSDERFLDRNSIKDWRSVRHWYLHTRVGDFPSLTVIITSIESTSESLNHCKVSATHEFHLLHSSVFAIVLLWICCACDDASAKKRAHKTIGTRNHHRAGTRLHAQKIMWKENGPHCVVSRTQVRVSVICVMIMDWRYQHFGHGRIFLLNVQKNVRRRKNEKWKRERSFCPPKKTFMVIVTDFVRLIAYTPWHLVTRKKSAYLAVFPHLLFSFPY